MTKKESNSWNKITLGSLYDRKGNFQMALNKTQDYDTS